MQLKPTGWKYTYTCVSCYSLVDKHRLGAKHIENNCLNSYGYNNQYSIHLYIYI